MVAKFSDRTLECSAPQLVQKAEPLSMAKFTKESCLRDLQQRILSTDLSPGLALEEAGLVEQYGLSRTPLREVLQRLSGRGF